MWGKAMESLFDSLDHFYYPIFGRGMEQQHWDKIEQALMEGKAIFAQVKLAPVGDHTFTIVAEDGRAYILHAWQGEHGLQAERSMPIPEMMAELKKLSTTVGFMVQLKFVKRGHGYMGAGSHGAY